MVPGISLRHNHYTLQNRHMRENRWFCWQPDGVTNSLHKPDA
jgi:hypothetical protein